MHFVKSILLLIVLLHISALGSSQQLNPETGVNQKHTKRPCEFSLFVGRSYLGPLKDIKTSMNASALHQVPGNQHVSTANPDLQKRASYFFEFKYNINQQSGISISRGKNDAFSILRDGNSPTVRSILKSTNVGYEHSLGHNRHELSLGISFMSLQMKSNNNDDNVYGKAVAKKVGLNMGYAYHLIETKGFFLAFQAQYNWAGTAEIGPYSIYEPGYAFDFLGLGLVTGSVPSQSTTFPATKVHLDSFNIGFSIGFRFGEMKVEAVPQNGESKF